MMVIQDEVLEALNDLTSGAPRRMRNASNILKENVDKIKDDMVITQFIPYLKNNIEGLTEEYGDIEVVFDNLLGIASGKLNKAIVAKDIQLKTTFLLELNLLCLQLIENTNLDRRIKHDAFVILQESDNEDVFNRIYKILDDMDKIENWDDLSNIEKTLKPVVRRNLKTKSHYYDKIKHLRDRLYNTKPDDKRITSLNKILKHARGNQ